MGSAGNRGDDWVKEGTIGVGKNALAWQILVNKHMISFLGLEYAKVVHFIHIALQPLGDLFGNHSVGMRHSAVVYQPAVEELCPTWLWCPLDVAKDTLLLLGSDEVRNVRDSRRALLDDLLNLNHKKRILFPTYLTHFEAREIHVFAYSYLGN